MGLETGTYINDLVTTNPVNSDQESQGAAHLRLIKSVLQNTFPGASRAWPLPNVPATTTVNATLARNNFNSTILVDTTAAPVTITLPTLVAGDAGWSCTFIRINTNLNPFFIAPPAGNIQSGEVSGLSSTRRCIPGHPTIVVWTGTLWFATRVPRNPVGTILTLGISSLPVGYEWANGQTLSSAANYPDYNTVHGNLATIDMRGVAAFGQDNVGGAGTRGLITVAGGNWDGTQFSGGGIQNRSLALANLPNFAPGASFSGTNQGWSLNQGGIPESCNTTGLVWEGAGTPVYFGVGNSGGAPSIGTPTVNVTPAGSVSVNSINGGVTQTSFATMPPGVTIPMVLVVE